MGVEGNIRVLVVAVAVGRLLLTEVEGTASETLVIFFCFVPPLPRADKGFEDCCSVAAFSVGKPFLDRVAALLTRSTSGLGSWCEAEDEAHGGSMLREPGRTPPLLGNTVTVCTEARSLWDTLVLLRRGE